MISTYKLVVLGEGRVGKTSMSLKYAKDQFDDKQQSTINASYLQKKERLSNNQMVKLAIWDTAGQEKYHIVAPVYYRDALGAIIAYEITSQESFEKMKKWVNELESHSPQGIILTIAGNKADLENQRKVRKEDAQKFAKSHNASHFLVSAKNGLNINAMFKDLADRIAESKASSKTSSKKNYKNPRLTIEREKPRQQQDPKSKKCC